MTTKVLGSVPFCWSPPEQISDFLRCLRKKSCDRIAECVFDDKSMAEDSRIQIKNGNYIGKLEVKGDHNHQQIDRVEAGATVVNKQVVESPIVKQTALEVQNLLV